MEIELTQLNHTQVNNVPPPVTLTTGQIIENALVAEGRKKIWLVAQVKQMGEDKNDRKLKAFTDQKLSRRINGHEPFEPNLVKAINKILKIKLAIPKPVEED